jgi:hypothetical protein
MALKYLTAIQSTIVAGLLVLTETICQAEDPAAIRFIPRSDASAGKDLETLRYALSKVKDSRGNIDPLSDYAKPPKSVSDEERNKRTAWKEDDEAWVAPSLTGNQGTSYRAPRIELESVEDLYTPLENKPKNLPTGTYSKTVPKTNFTDGFRPVEFVDDRSRVASQSSLASALYTSSTGLERLSRFQEIPFGCKDRQQLQDSETFQEHFRAQISLHLIPLALRLPQRHSPLLRTLYRTAFLSSPTIFPRLRLQLIPHRL